MYQYNLWNLFLILQNSNWNCQGPKPLWNMIYSYKDE